MNKKKNLKQNFGPNKLLSDIRSGWGASRMDQSSANKMMGSDYLS